MLRSLISTLHRKAGPFERPLGWLVLFVVALLGVQAPVKGAAADQSKRVHEIKLEIADVLGRHPAYLTRRKSLISRISERRVKGHADGYKLALEAGADAASLDGERDRTTFEPRIRHLDALVRELRAEAAIHLSDCRTDVCLRPLSSQFRDDSTFEVSAFQTYLARQEVQAADRLAMLAETNQDFSGSRLLLATIRIAILVAVFLIVVFFLLYIGQLATIGAREAPVLGPAYRVGGLSMRVHERAPPYQASRAEGERDKKSSAAGALGVWVQLSTGLRSKAWVLLEVSGRAARAISFATSSYPRRLAILLARIAELVLQALSRMLGQTVLFHALWLLILGSMLFGMRQSGNPWHAAVFYATLLYTIQAWYQRGLARSEAERRMGVIWGSFAGALDSFGQNLGRGNGVIDEPTAKHLSISLLARAKQVAVFLYEPAEKVRLRASLAVPILKADGSLAYIRVWCYDQPYANRRWSKFPPGLPGCPAAFAQKRTEIIRDLHKLDVDEVFKGRDFRSVLSIPVVLGGMNGDVLAVMSIDSTEPDFFTKASLSKLLPLLMPIVNTLALVLRTRSQGSGYEFD